MWDRLVLGHSEWLIGVAIFGFAMLLVLIIGYRRARLPLGFKVVAIGLKSIAIGLTLLCLLEPLATRQRPKPQANWVAILADDSQSMQAIANVSDENSSNDGVEKTPAIWKQALSSDAPWQQQLGEEFRLRRYRFGSRLEAMDDLDAMTNSQSQTSLFTSLNRVSERFRDLPLAGVVLFSDGQATDSRSKHLSWKNLGIPIYPVRLPMSKGMKDVWVSNLTMRQSDFEAAPVTMVATIQNQGLNGKSVNVELVDDDAKIVQTQLLKLEGNQASQLVEFRFRPEKPGVQGFRVRTRLSENTDTEIDRSETKTAIELTLLNNQRSEVVDRGRGPYRILYVAGRPNWEHKFLRRALQEDDEIHLASLVRIAKKEPKFSFRDSKVDSANPLFSGFEDISEEEKEQFNEPVFVRLGVEDATQLKGGFPKTTEELFAYQAVILDDLDTDFLSADQQALIRQFVSFRGGGLLFLGGQESMRGKGFRESILAQLLPVYGEVRPAMAKGESLASAPPVFRFDLTREGWLQPFLRTADTEAAQRKSLTAMPSLQVLNESGGVKPGAVVFANAVNEDSKLQPALITQRFGKGRTAVLLIGDMWRWGLHHDQATQSPLFQAWRQMIRWLIADVPRSISMSIESALDSNGGQTAKISVEILSTNFQTVDNSDVEIAITKPDGSILKGKAEPSARQSGIYELPFVTTDDGVYKAVATAMDADGSVRGTSQIGWVHEPSASELQSLGMNLTLLSDLARRSGGEMLELKDLDRLRLKLAARPVPITETKIEPLWQRGWILALITSCLGGEWWIRRKNGLR